MLELAGNLENIVSDFIDFTNSNDTSYWNWKPNLDKWSKKEILGHLVDSAINNLQRLVRGTYEEDFKIIYNQDQWVKVQHYNEASLTELVELWRLLNKQIIRIIRSYPEDRLEVKADIGQYESEVLTMREIASGYIEHLLHHLYQIRHYHPSPML